MFHSDEFTQENFFDYDSVKGYWTYGPRKGKVLTAILE
jgi:hypothetical protein